MFGCIFDDTNLFDLLFIQTLMPLLLLIPLTIGAFIPGKSNFPRQCQHYAYLILLIM